MLFTLTEILTVNVSNMKERQILYFGTVNAEQLAASYATTALIDDRSIELDLHFETTEMTAALESAVNGFLQNITRYDQQNRTYMKEDFSQDGETLDFVRFYLDELKRPQLARILGPQEEHTSIPHQLLDKLQLIRIGIYPDSPEEESDYFAIFDYTLAIDGRPGHEILAVTTDQNGALDYISWES